MDSFEALGGAGNISPFYKMALQAGDPLLLQRKGHLFFLATEEADPDALERIMRAFYASRSFDAVPTLVRVLAQAYQDSPSLMQALPLVIVIRGLEVAMVGTAEGAVRLVRFGMVRDLFSISVHAGSTPLQEHQVSPHGPTLYSSHWRLAIGDVMVITTRALVDRLGDARLVRIARSGHAPQRMARALVRRAHLADTAPVLVFQQGRLAPVPEIESKEEPIPEAPRPMPRGFSPIWLALAFAVLSILFALQVTGTRLEGETIREYLVMFFFPQPTPTPTILPEEILHEQTPSVWVYTPPIPLNPYEGARITDEEVRFVWEWDGELAPDEFFEVILWPPDDEEARALTRTPYHKVQKGTNGWYAWSVRIVKAPGQETPQPLSAEAPPVSFLWQ